MNLINDFDMERISQAIEDIGSLCIADIFSPGKLWYAPVKMDWKTAPEFDPFGPMDRWGGYDEYGWFRCMPRILSFFYTVMKNRCKGWICITKVVF